MTMSRKKAKMVKQRSETCSVAVLASTTEEEARSPRTWVFSNLEYGKDKEIDSPLQLRKGVQP